MAVYLTVLPAGNGNPPSHRPMYGCHILSRVLAGEVEQVCVCVCACDFVCVVRVLYVCCACALCVCARVLTRFRRYKNMSWRGRVHGTQWCADFRTDDVNTPAKHGPVGFPFVRPGLRPGIYP